MKKPSISFRVIGDSGPLTLSWFEGPKGIAVEAKSGEGVGFFSTDHKLLCVEFDDVEKKQDHQKLSFDSVQVEVWVKNGKVKIEVHHFSEMKKRA